MNTFTTTLMAVATFATQANAFWGTGHLLIARGAQTILEDENPAALQQALDMMTYLKRYYPDITDNEDNHPFTECATFADDIKGQGYSFQSGWHFIDQPYLEEGGSLDDFDFKPDQYDVLDALTDLTAFLKGEKGPSDSYYIKQIANYFSYEVDQQSFALRLIIHYVGDIHQPLHGVAAVDSEFPTGDRGGNSEHIPSQEGASNLHAVWDSMIYMYPGYPNLPLSDSDWDWYTSTSDDIASTYPIDDSLIKAGDFQGWADEDLTLAEEDVYADFVEGEIPSEEYQTRAKSVLLPRINYGSRRLADLISDIFGGAGFDNATPFLQ